MKTEKRSSYEQNRRDENLFQFTRTMLAILISVGITFIIIACVSKEPLEAIFTFVTGPFSTLRRFGNVLEAAIPILFTGLAACVMFQAKQFSLIADGAFYIGGFLAALVTIYCPFQGVGATVLAILAATALGALCGVLPGFLRAKWGANEFVVSMMFNYIVIAVGQYLFMNRFRDPGSGNVATAVIPEADKLAGLIPRTKVHAGLILALIVTVLVYQFMYRSRTGFAIRMTGINPRFTGEIGFSTFGVLMLVQIIGAALGGFGGAVEVLGMYDRFQWQDTLGYGFDGMTVAILAANNPALVPLGALFLAYMRVGTEVMARTTSVPNEMIYIVQGIMMLLVTATGFLVHWRHRLLLKRSAGRQESDEGQA